MCVFLVSFMNTQISIYIGLASNATEWGETGRAIYQYEESTVCLNVRTWCHRTIIESSCQSKWHLLPNEEGKTYSESSTVQMENVLMEYIVKFSVLNRTKTSK